MIERMKEKIRKEGTQKVESVDKRMEESEKEGEKEINKDTRKDSR